MAWIKTEWENMLGGLWFVPGCVAAAYGLLAIVLTSVEAGRGQTGGNFGFTGSANIAGTLLSTIAGSLITVTGLALSLTIVTVQLVSGQFTPRAIGNFLGDRGIQLITGALIGTFAYCLLVLRVLRASGDGHAAFVPSVSISLAIVLSLGAIGLLVVFVHRVSQMIQVNNIVRSIAHVTLHSVDRTYPDGYRQADDGAAPAPRSGATESGGTRVSPTKMGYVRRIDVDAMVAAAPSGARITVLVPRGSFVTENATIATVTGEETTARAVRRSVTVAADRHLANDPGFGLQQLSDIALRALSPGINDPRTALTCIFYLQAVMERLVTREIPRGVQIDTGRDVMITVRQDDFADMIEVAFGAVGRYASADAGVAVALLEAIGAVAQHATAHGAGGRAAALRAVAIEVAATASSKADWPSDKGRIANALQDLRLKT